MKTASGELKALIDGLLCDSREKQEITRLATRMVRIMATRYGDARDIYASLCAAAWNEEMARRMGRGKAHV